MKPSRKALVALSLAILVCAASIKALYHHHLPTVFSSFDSFTWRAEQLLSYSWIRITNPPKYGTLRWEVQQAKLKGVRDLQTGIIACAWEFRDPQTALQEALSNYAVILAKPIEKNTYADDYEVATWYKFKILETLSPRPLTPCTSCSFPGEPPKDSLPITADEIVMLEGGGAMNVDSFKDTYSTNYSVGYLLRQKYLIFLRLDSVKRTGYAHRRSGVYTVSGEGEIRPITRNRNALQEYLQAHDQNSLDQLRVDIQERLGAKK
jgi:hypothetical protein